MKVGIYNEPSGSVGGSEYVVSVLAHALSERHQVEIVHHNQTLAIDQLEQLSGLELASVRLRLVDRQEPPDPRVPSGLRNLHRRYRAEIDWQADFSRPYDLFIVSTHSLPPFCHAPTGVLLTLFPFHDRLNMWPWLDDATVCNRLLKEKVKHAYYGWLWRERFHSYQYRFSISEYVRKWTRALWRIETDILYPPVDTFFDPVPKANLLLSVGRFSTVSHSKRQVEIMGAFSHLKRTALRDWSYHSVGGLADHPADHAYFDQIRRIARDCRAEVTANIARADLRQLLSRAKIFWHAAGYGRDENTNPFQAEHFGISTVEAMAAGCVPVVYDHGGQPEIVEHGRSGYLWRTLDELGDYTRRLAQDDGLRQAMSVEARQRATGFGRQAFLDNFVRLTKLRTAVLGH
jgi:glycosyltransferase involved in cell wall biosynthesis